LLQGKEKSMANAADNPMAFLNMARQYQKAAGRLLDSVAEEPKEGPQEPLSDPIYFLYFQAVELGLKAAHPGAQGSRGGQRGIGRSRQGPDSRRQALRADEGKLTTSRYP
jgi:hypothetical protein